VDIKSKVHVSIPFDMLIESYLDALIENRVNPEISFNSKSLDNYSKKDYEHVAKILHSHGLSVTLHAPYMDLCPGSPDPKVKEVAKFRFIQVLDLVPIFKASSVVFHTGFDEKKYYEVRNIWLENSLQIWNFIAKGLKKFNSKLMLENVFEKRPEDMLYVIKELDSFKNVKLCFDAAHAYVFSILPLQRWAKTLSPYIGELHLHNNYGNWDEHRGVNNGLIDFEELLNIIAKETDKIPVITLEVHNDEEFWSSLEYLEKIWPWKEEEESDER